MKQLAENASMYGAVLENISESTVRTAISYYGKKYSFEKVLFWIDRLADNLAAEYSIGKGKCVPLCMPNSPAALLSITPQTSWARSSISCIPFSRPKS